MRWLIVLVLLATTLGGAEARERGRHGGSAGAIAGFSPDSAFIEGAGATFSPVTGSGTSLLTSYGVWTLGTYRIDIAGHWCIPANPVPNGCSDFYELFLNGHRIAQAERAGVNFGGRLLRSEEDQNFWLWSSWGTLPNSGCYWDAFGCNGPADPGSYGVEVPGLPTWPPVSTTPPADGTFITTALLGSTIANQYGVWSWGGPQTGGYEVRLNGTTIGWDPPHLVATRLQVGSNGQMFIQHPDGSWRVYLDYAEASASAPTGQAIPLHMDMTPTAAPVSVPCGDLILRSPNAGPTTAKVGYLTVPMSNGSPFAGTVTIGANSGITLFNAAVLGDGRIELTPKQSPIYGLDNFAGISITASQNGTSVGLFLWWFDKSGC